MGLKENEEGIKKKRKGKRLQKHTKQVIESELKEGVAIKSDVIS